MYLINSSLRTGDNLLVETINTTISNTGNLSCVNTLLSDRNVMIHMFDDILSDTTGEIFTTSINSSNKININSQTCYFKLDISSNINTYNPYNLLGFSSSTLPNTFYNTITGSNDINLNTPIYQSNIFQLDILKTSSDETFQIYQPNFVIQNLCQLIQDKLIINTNLSWKVVYDIVSNRVTITLISTNNFTFSLDFSSFTIPEYAFKFFWTDSRMVHIANALGFTEQSVFNNDSITAENPPLIDTILSNNDIIILNTEKTNYTANTNHIEFSPGTSNANQFINTLADQLSKETNMKVIVTINNNDNKITITFQPYNTNFYLIKILFSDPNMLNIANVLGFPAIDIEAFANNGISGIYPVNYNLFLFPTDLFKIIKNEISFDSKSYQLYEIPLNLPIYNPTECIDQISKKLSDTTTKPWSISSNTGLDINNNSYLKMNLYDTDTSFRILWGNVNSGNISKSMGFANIDTPDFVNTIISGNIIDFNYNLNYTDQLNYEIKSNIYYKLDDFIIPTDSNEDELNEYIVNLSKELQNVTGKKYSVYFQESTQKIYISVSDTNTTFQILFGHPSMTNIAKMLGFNPVNTPKYVNYLVSDNIVDFGIQLNIEDIFFMIQKSNNYDFSTTNTISFNQSYFLSNIFINNLQDILTTKTNKNWSVSQISNILTIQVNSPNCSFQFLWGDEAMKNVSTALGFDTVNPSTFLTTITSNNNINKLIQFNNNDQLIFKFRDTTQTYSIPKSYLYNVPDDLYNSQKFIKSLALILYNLTNKIFEVIYDTITQKITIQIDSSNSYFKIQWQLPSMKLIGQMMGFNNTETSEYTTKTTGQNAANLYIQLNNTSVFSISIIDKVNINYDSSINKYMLRIDPNFFYPDYFFQYMANLINKDLVYPLTFLYNPSTRKLTISSTNKFQIDFVNLTNLAKVLGFNFMVSPTYELSFTGANQIDMTERVLPTDLFRVRFLQSINKFQINFFDFYAEYHTKLLGNYLYLYTGLLWNSVYNSITKKISIMLYATKYKFIFTDPKMKTIATIFGFDTTTLPPFEYTQTSNYPLSFSTYSGNTLVVLPEQYDSNNAVVIYSFEPNYNIPKKYTLYIEPIIYTPTLLVSYLQTKLNVEIPGIGFVVNYDSITNKITISTTSLNIKFRFLFGKSILISKLMGFNNSDIYTYENSITSEKEIIMSGQFGKIIIDPNAIINFNKITLKNIQLPILENITDFNNTLTIENISIVNNNPIISTKKVKIYSGYYTDITIPLQNALNTSGIGNFTVSLLNNKLTINCNIPFKILWSKNTVLSLMCGFNPTDMTNLTTSVSSDFWIDLVYPKNIYLDLDGIKYQSNFFNNKHMFLIHLNSNINDDMPTLKAPNNSVNKLIFSLYDENNYLISPTKNWNATIEFS
jgi:hypothetical protein